jgi:hypothetical protein
MALEEGAGVLVVLFGVGPCGGDPVKRFVEDANDPLLFAYRNWVRNLERGEVCSRDLRLGSR